MVTLNEQISQAWRKVLLDKTQQANCADSIQHDIQDVAFVISQLVEPTISIIVQLAALYIAIKKGNDNAPEHEQQVEQQRTAIKEILDNYNLDTERADDMINAIIASLMDK